MRQRLRKIPELLSAHRIYLLGKKLQRTLIRQDVLKQFARLVQTPKQDVIVDQPERACRKSSLFAWNVVQRFSVPIDQAAAHQPPFDLLDGGKHSRVVGSEHA